MLSGLLIAAAGAAGLQTSGLPIVHVRPDGGVSAVLMLEECHLILHAHPARRMLFLDLLAPATKDWSRVLEVFTRRIPASAVHQDVRHRAGATTDRGISH
ncbi:MAG: S-adenosylmethionine decarboxylase related protein [Gemmatimonadetes bacterium]|nr:S-adenosylmethionine decarboxylase related protein [Gemmatimonadota bacterium]